MYSQRRVIRCRISLDGQGLLQPEFTEMTYRGTTHTHPDNDNLLYLTDSDTTLQIINKWIGGGAKLRLVKTVDADILRVIVIKLQQRVKAKAATLLIKVKTHRGCPLNEEADIRPEMGRMKQQQEKTWIFVPPNKQRGPRRSETEYVRKQGRSKLTAHTRRHVSTYPSGPHSLLTSGY
jgi:hypothetical protein